MATFSRSRSTLPNLNSVPTVRPARPLQHAVPQFQSEMAGIDPRAGDMSAAFSQFFNSLSNTANQIADARFQAEKQKQLDINETAKREAVVAAQRTFEDPNNKGASAGSLLKNMPNTIEYNGEAVNITQRPSYTETYSRVIGSLTGTRAYYDFLDQMDKENVIPEQRETRAGQYWQQIFADGTGNAYHDASAQKVWTDNIQNWRFENSKEINKRAAAKLMVQTDDMVFNRAADGELSWDEYHESIVDYRNADPSLTDGAVRSKVLSSWIAAAARSPKAARRLSAFIHEQPTDPETGKAGQSLYERFPKEMSLHLAQLNKSASEYMTLQGTEAVNGFSSSLSSASALPTNTAADYQNKVQKFVEMGIELNKLENTPGVSVANIAKLKSKWADELAKVTRAHVRVNQLNDAAANGKRVNTMTQKEMDESARTLISQNDFMQSGKSVDAFVLGQKLNNLRVNNNGYFPKDAIAMATGGLQSADPATVANTIKFLAVVDPDRTWFSTHLKDSPMVAAMYEAYSAPGTSIEANIALFQGENFKTAMGQVDMTSIFWGDNIDNYEKSKHAARVEDYFFGDSGTGESIAERIVDNDYWFSDLPKLSPAVRRYSLSIAKIYAARHFATTGEQISLDKLKDDVANHLRTRVVPSEDDFIDFERDAPVSNSRVDLSSNQRPQVRYGRNVPNPEGNVEDTVANVGQAVQDITETGLIGLVRADGSDDIALVARDVPALRGKNAKMLFDRNTSQPFLLPVGETLKTQDVYDKKGKRYNSWMAVIPWADAFSNRDVKLTGDPTQDAKIASRFLHPSINMHPLRIDRNDPESKIIGYQLSINPFFNDLSDEFMTKDALQKAIDKKGPLYRQRKPEDEVKLMFSGTRAGR